MNRILFNIIAALAVLSILFMLIRVSAALWFSRPDREVVASEYTSSIVGIMFFIIAAIALVIGLIMMIWHYQR